MILHLMLNNYMYLSWYVQRMKINTYITNNDYQFSVQDNIMQYAKQNSILYLHGHKNQFAQTSMYTTTIQVINIFFFFMM